MDARSPTPLHRLTDAEVERLLATGERRAELVAAFGPRACSELADLARRAAAVRRRGGPVVYVLPGLMGSRLGTRGRPFDDVVWLDPLEVVAGRLTRLALPRGHRLVALGAMLLNTLKLKLSLEIAGCDARLHAYDWRLDVESLAAALLRRIERDGVRQAMLVGHSLGGVVARQALALGDGRIARVVQVGAPNHGSYAPVLAMRGVYPTVRKLAALDLRHDAEGLARLVFRTLPSLYELLPARESPGDLDWFDVASWPDDAQRPDRHRLVAAAAALDRRPAPDPRCLGIVGLGQPTVVAAERTGDGGLRYRASADGDGTVPRVLAELPGCPTWYVSGKHGGLPNDGRVIDAVLDLLRSGRTDRLPAAPLRRARSAQLWLSEAMLRRVAPSKVGWSDLSPEARRRLLEPVVSPEFHGRAPSRAPAPGSYRPRDGAPRRRLELRLVHGGIEDSRERALAVGAYVDVDPSGAARVIDRRLDGAITALARRRSLGGRLGDVHVLRCPPGRLRAECVLIAGLGEFVGFDAAAHARAAGAVVEACARDGIGDVATVLFGGGSGLAAVDALDRQLRGMLGTLDATDPRCVVRRITIVEVDRRRHAAIRRALPALAARLAPPGVRIEVDTGRPGAGPSGGARRVGRPGRAVDDPAWLLVTMHAAGRGAWDCSSALLTAGAKAAVLAGTVRIGAPALRTLVAAATPERLAGSACARYGDQLARALLADSVRAGLEAMARRPLVIVHDREASCVPWETLRVGNRHPALDGGLSRRYRSEALTAARWRADRPVGARPRAYLAVNPTRDLPGADDEGAALRIALEHGGFEVRSVAGAAATRATLLAAGAADDCDVLHFAGHAYFDPDDPGDGGLVCAGGEVLRGRDLASLPQLPALVFFNACEAARVRRPAAARRKPEPGRSASIAEAILDGGVANFLGTHWPVGDDAAGRFATQFYSMLADGWSIGDAVLEARRSLHAAGSVDWADYLHYGDPGFALGRPGSR